MNRPPFPAPLVAPARSGLPVLLSVPHSGRHYSTWLLEQARGGISSLEPLEDPLVDRLVWRAQALGIGSVIARTPRAAIDCNRSLSEVDSATVAVPPDGDPGPRARGGLGIVPGRTPRDGELWRRKVTRQELERRLQEAYHPYHEAIAEGLAAMKQRHGMALLLDCHSMPARAPALPRVVLGDRHGTSCARWLGDLARQTVEQAGFSVSFNDPYAGGWIVERHGAPANEVHALQVELDRGIYLGAGLRRPGPDFDRAARMLETLARTLGQALLDHGRALPIAAE